MEMPDPKIARRQRSRLEHRLRRLVKMIELNAPNKIIASDMAMTFYGCCAIIPETTQFLGQRMVADARRRNGMCELCGKEVNQHINHGRICEHCDAKEDAEMRAWEEANPDLVEEMDRMEEMEEEELDDDEDDA